MAPIHYTFSNKSNYLRANVKSKVTGEEFTITSFGIDEKHLESTTVEAPDGKKGLIHWRIKEEVIEVDGKKYAVADVMTKEKGTESRHTRRWNIAGGHYQTVYDEPYKAWQIFVVQNGIPGGSPILTFYQYKSSFLRAIKEYASIEVESSVSKDTLLKLILIVLYSHHTQLRDIPPGFAESAASGVVGIKFPAWG